VASYIFKKEKIILRCSGGAMSLLYDFLIDTIQREKLPISDAFKVFLSRMQQYVDAGPILIDLEKHLPTSEDRIMLKTLVSKVIIRLKEEKSLSDEVAPRIIGGFEEFRDKILD